MTMMMSKSEPRNIILEHPMNACMKSQMKHQVWKTIFVSAAATGRAAKAPVIK
jgi:hypothetical protein